MNRTLIIVAIMSFCLCHFIFYPNGNSCKNNSKSVPLSPIGNKTQAHSLVRQESLKGKPRWWILGDLWS
jgi:hypothetical protein